MKYVISIILIFLFSISTIYGQDSSNDKEYDKLISKSDSLFKMEKYKEAAFTFLEAIKWTDGKAYLNHRYDAVCAFTLAGYADSAFNHLNILATKGKFGSYKHLATDIDLISLHNDNRWKPLLEIVKQNKEKADAKWTLVCQDNEDMVDRSKAEINNYTLDVDINVKAKIVTVKGYVDIDFQGEDSIDVVLSKDAQIKTIGSNNTELKYLFDTISKSPIMYIPDGRKLTIYRNKNSSDKQKVYFDYLCDMGTVAGWGRSFSDDWIEIGYYTAWYPVGKNSGSALSELSVSIDEPYKISGSGVVTQKGNKWIISHDWPVFDNIIIASKDLKSKKMQFGNTAIEIAYTTFPESDMDSVFVAFNDVLEFYEQIYGSQNSPYMKFVICPTEGGGGYSRKNYISLKVNKFSFQLKKGVAHELAHFWWNKADSNIWEDWLNEAFAEYSMLLYIKKELGQAIFDTYIDAYKVNASKSCPIWGVDRAKPGAYVALYEKGALILYDFHQQVGDDKYFSFSRKILQNNINTTIDFLSLVNKEFGVDMRNWFEMKLKAKNNE